MTTNPSFLHPGQPGTDQQDASTNIKASVLSLIAHELRAPLNTINGYLDLALAGIGGELNEQQHEFVQRARAGSEHLYALLEDLLLISRVDTGQLRLHQDVVNLPQVIALAVEELELQAADQKITVEVTVPSSPPRISGDAVRLQQVVRNLLSNAIRFTPSGGNVHISTWIEQGAFSDLAVSTTMAFLQVQDNGPGIATEYHQRIFERFFQVPNVSTGRASGPGLGLAVARLLVELHGGSLTIESVPAQGSSFVCRFPSLLS
jgi:signal transduction histidine kinase